MTNRFGRRLFSIFFKTYTEKVWGMPCQEISRRLGRPTHQGPLADEGDLNAIMPQREEAASAIVKTLIDAFDTRAWARA